ncbi:flippase activity-associated protein Agl23 [Haloarchaeobius sp. TZWWS8]|uniref:flippase activity-associated protein Agl23 n=1 Tax=Haloarchaeobius sp. TZWWS8 TaxID=3446121 RepID=UPI003EBF4F9B
MSDESPRSPDEPSADDPAHADGGSSRTATSAEQRQTEPPSGADAAAAEDAESASPGTTAGDVTTDRDGLVPFPSSDRALGALVVIALVGLAARLVWLGSRIAHQDEGRVGYWILRYLESGVWEYRPIVHGPFLFHVNKYVFQLLGPSDFTARLVPALLGATLPLAAWLYRKHLRDTELVALGVLFAFNPVLLYYSRFMREDIPLVVFAAWSLGFFVRYLDDRQRWHLVVAVGTFALALTTKENSLLYPLCWLGAAYLLLDHRAILAPARGDRTPFEVFVAYLDRVLPFDLRANVDRARRFEGDELIDSHIDWWKANLVSVGFALSLVVEFFAIIVLFYAPRGGGFTEEGVAGFPGPEQAGMGIGLWRAIGTADVSMFGSVVWEATVGSWEQFTGTWASGGHQDHSFLLFFEHYVDVLFGSAFVVVVFAVIGFVVDRYSARGPRDLVALASYWGFVSVLGYPIATDIRAGWATSHAILPLAIPAAVGIGIVLRWGLEAFTDDDGVGVALAVILVLLISGSIAAPAVQQVYIEPQDTDNKLIQYAQSSSTDLKPTLADVETVGYAEGDADDVDVMFYGNKYYVSNESDNLQPHAGGGYFERRTLMWYMEMYHYRATHDGDPSTAFNVDSTLSLSALNETRPPVVMAVGNGSNGQDAEEIHDWMLENGYEARQFQRFLSEDRTAEGGGPGTPFMIYIKKSAASEAGLTPLSSTESASLLTAEPASLSASAVTSSPSSVPLEERVEDRRATDTIGVPDRSLVAPRQSRLVRSARA